MANAPAMTTEVKTQIEAAKLLARSGVPATFTTPPQETEELQAAAAAILPFKEGDYVHVKTVTMYYGGYLLRVLDFFGHQFLQLADSSWIIDMGRDVAECGQGKVADLSRFVPGTMPLIHVAGIIEMFKAEPLQANK